MIGTLLLWIIIIVLFLLGLIGIILPFLPGVPLIFIATLIYGLATDFSDLSRSALFWLGGLAVFAIAIDYFSGILGAKKYGASHQGMVGAFLGAIIGLLSLGLIGLIVGPFLGALLFELLAGQKQQQALKSGLGTLIGFLAGTLFKFIIALIMIGIFFYQIIF